MESFINGLSEKSAAALSRHKAHYPSGAELSLQLLKGHLLLEELVREVLKVSLNRPEALEGQAGATFNCHQAICLAEATAKLSQLVPWIWPALKKLNAMRNKLAHRLDYAILHADIRGFTDFCTREQPDIEADMQGVNMPPDRLFEACVMSVATVLVVLSEPVA